MKIAFLLETPPLDWFWVATVLLLVIALIVAISFAAAANTRDTDYRRNLLEKGNSVRVFVIDYPSQTVTFFNVTTLRAIRTMPLTDFYGQFPNDEQVRLIEWISELLDPESNAPTYMETGVMLTKSHKQYFSMLEVSSINRKLGRIHMESYLFKFMSPDRIGKASLKLTTVKELQKLVHGSMLGKGVTCVAYFRYRKPTEQDRAIDPRVFDQLKDVVFQSCSGPRRYLLQVSGNEIALTDLKLTGQPKAVFLVETLLKSVKRHLAINSLTSSIEVRVGICEHLPDFHNDIEPIIAEAKKAAHLAYDVNAQYAWYQKGKKNSFALTESSYRSEVERIINDKRLSFMFRPMFSVLDMKVVGYLSQTQPIDAYFPSIDELKNYAARADEAKNLFATIAKNVIPTYVAERESAETMLYYPIRVDEMDYVLPTFSNITTKFRNNRISFMIAEDDIRSHLSNLGVEGFSKAISLIKTKGYQVTLLVNGSELMLPDAIYPTFDNYIVSFAFAGVRAGIDTKIRAELHALVERLIKYRKPIMASDVDGWNAIELLVRSGLNYISAEVFAPYDAMITPVNPKSIKKLSDLKG